MKRTSADWIKKLDLKPHPEGGYYRETYRSKEVISKKDLPARYAGDRNFSTSIYYLLEGFQKSKFHCLKSDEFWHFYDGTTVRVYFIDNSGNLKESLVGLGEGALPQLLIPAGTWFAAEVTEEAGYVLVGCTVSPGFDFQDFDIQGRKNLIERFPQHKKTIEKLI